ncbi:flagellar basal body L-ring protein FlgH [Pseudoalteromonas mariniglutinosa]|uniref:flagellar basal body L-ring protein FlgH n=1 Tax=Pseudoalteromonas mariniglutinosa TaxID=206042 RepID=UPI00384F06E0
MRNFICITSVAILLGGCVTTQNKHIVQDDPYYAPMYPEVAAEQVVPTGSLFDSYLSNDLYSDKKALRTGDIITVKLQESTQASKAAKTETDKESDANLEPVIGLGGAPVTYKGDSLQFGVSSGSSFTGDSKSNQSNSLFGDISVNVMRVLPNGNLVIRGEKWLTLNNGEEFIRLEGLVRPDDVTADNTVTSNRVANARIQYSGKGQLQETQSAGWLTRFFSSSLFPF